MEKQKPWQLIVIAAVFLVTLLNILPTVFYYSKPLSHSVEEGTAIDAAEQMVQRVDSLADDATQWLWAFSKNLKLKPRSIKQVETSPQLIEVQFDAGEDARLFKRFLPRAGSLIAFAPAQLRLSDRESRDPERIVYVERQVSTVMGAQPIKELFQYGRKLDQRGRVTTLYRSLIDDRLSGIMDYLGGGSRYARALSFASEEQQESDEMMYNLARDVVHVHKTFGDDSTFTKRWDGFFSSSPLVSQEKLVDFFVGQLEKSAANLNARVKNLEAGKRRMEESGELFDVDSEQRIEVYRQRVQTLEEASRIVRRYPKAFRAGPAPYTSKEIKEVLAVGTEELYQEFDLGGRHPFIQELHVDWSADRVRLMLFDDIVEILAVDNPTEEQAFLREKVSQLLVEEISRLSRATEEQFMPEGSEGFAFQLNELTSSESFLVLNLGKVAESKANLLKQDIHNNWKPTHTDLRRENFPVWHYSEFKALQAQESKLGLVVYAPAADMDGVTERGFRPGSIYIIARGVQDILEKYEAQMESADAELFMREFTELRDQLQDEGFIGYVGGSFGFSNEFERDYIFELGDYYQPLLAATREAFQVKGSKRYAVVEFTDYEQRLLTINRIENSIHEDILQWRDQYQAAQVDLDPSAKYTVPKPTKNPYWSNLMLSYRKFFRGDEGKILKWGLDLAGGKTVRVELRDQNGNVVTNPEELNQAVNELYTRINRMGVSEQTIRVEGAKILLEFPGSQNLSAEDLIQASSMKFHIVNERFSVRSQQYGDVVQRFLQSVWNEAVVSNRTDIQSINEIAWQQLGGDLDGGTEVYPQSEDAKLLVEGGLRFAAPGAGGASMAFDDTLSMLGIRRGDGPNDWHGLSHPLIVVFRNYALEGASLTSVQAGYDPAEGNLLNFSVRSAYSNRSGNPRDDFYSWTSQFSEDRIVGTSREEATRGDGWRMAVVLNDRIISDPSLKAPLKSGGRISGHFTQREVNRLVSDLKAGSLSYTPHILSETNISPDLGRQERVRGIGAALVGAALVVVVMCGYYRFAGIIASLAVIFNLLIMWGVLQNLDAALTLPGIAGIILTVGMAVDANVLVFERIREEFKKSGRLASAVATGYRKAFSAIVDSNLTTILAALILIQFDAGPIKGFAVTLIIGIASSMFTALFMTRYFFSGWVQNTKRKCLNMMSLMEGSNFDFLRNAKPMLIISLTICLIGGGLWVGQRHSILGMEFTGGYSLTLEVDGDPGSTSYRALATEALEKAGASSIDFQIKRLNRDDQLRIQFGQGMELEGRPWYGLVKETEGETAHPYQSNPRIVWVVDSLAAGGLTLSSSKQEFLHQNWSAVSGQFSDVMRNHALMALGTALICILLYITFRFEFKYAVSAIAALTHDVLVTLGVISILHWIGVPIQIDLEAIGAMMTIIGYSLNDTIIIFDRIREDEHIFRKMRFIDVVNQSINVTLGRTILTSGTTLLVLMTLVLLGGSAIMGFALIMTIGVLFGTFSSLFIACPVMLLVHRWQRRQRELQASAGSA